MKQGVAKICFYCKKLIKKGKCSKCGNNLFINVPYTRVRISPWYAIRRKYHYTVTNTRYKYVEKQLNEQ